MTVNITAADVKLLRELTGAGMLDCRNALAESGGDQDKAIEWLRIRGNKRVDKQAARATGQGLIAAADGVMLELACETDFAAKSPEVRALADRIAAAAAKARREGRL